VRSPAAALLVPGSLVPLALASPTFVVGRGKGADLQLEGNRISRAHAVVFEQAGGHFIRDLSREGTRVNGQPIRSLALKGAETIEIGGLEFRYECAALAHGNADASHSLDHRPTAENVARLGDRSPDEPGTNQDDSADEQYVFAPEPEILPDPAGSNSQLHCEPIAAPVSADFQPADPVPTASEEIGQFDTVAATGGLEAELGLDSVSASSQQAETAHDLVDWGITVDAGVAQLADPQPTVSPPTLTSSAPAKELSDENLAEQPVASPLPDPANTDATKDNVLSWEGTLPSWDARLTPAMDRMPADAELCRSAAPGLSEPIDLATLADSPPSDAPPVEAISHAEQDPATLQSSFDDLDNTIESTSAEASSPMIDATTPDVSQMPPQSGIMMARPPGPGLRSLDEILGSEILHLSSPSEKVAPQPQTITNRGWWVGAAVIGGVALAIASWLYFGNHLRMLLMR
jgi:hypothetical protein